MLTKKLIALLESREFLHVATADRAGRPNAAPKFLLKARGDTVYLVDYTIGTTWKNLTINPRVSLSLVDQKTLKAYQLNGAAVVISKGAVYERMRQETLAKQIRLTAKHVIEDVRGGEGHEMFEVSMTDRFIVFKIVIDEIVEMEIRGGLRRRRKEDGVIRETRR